jgi:hypothetical protein
MTKYRELAPLVDVFTFDPNGRPCSDHLLQTDPEVIKAEAACAAAFDVFYAFFETPNDPLRTLFPYTRGTLTKVLKMAIQNKGGRVSFIKGFNFKDEAQNAPLLEAG